MFSHQFRILLAAVVAVSLLASCGFRRKKYDNPITKDTQQPDKVLFDKAIADIERSRFEIARLTLQTLINTYDSSEYLAKAKLAIADSWYREGGGHGLAQAEAEYKDFILFYPAMEESAEAQQKVCDIHYKQMEKYDRDPQHAIRAEDECRQLLVQFPNSKFAPEAQQKLRNIQEVLAQKDFGTGQFYMRKGSYPAAAARLNSVVDQYPLFSAADESLWLLGDAYTRMGDRFEDRAANAYTRIVRDYPLSERAEEAKKRLAALKRPIPEADPVAMERMRYEIENRDNPSLMSHLWGIFRKNPDTHLAAKSGTPAMNPMRPTVPVSVPAAAAGTTGVTGDVSVQTVTDPTALDKQPDARQNPPAQQQPGQAAAPDNGSAGQPAAAAQDQQPLPTNHAAPAKPSKKQKNNKKEKKAQK